MATTEIILSLVKLFLMIIPGYILSKKNIIDEHQCKGVSSLVVNLTWPCLIVCSLQMAFSVELVINMGYIAAAMVCAMIIAYAFAKGACKAMKIDKSKAYLITFMLMFGNTGFMGIPVCTVLYGQEGTFYAALLDAIGDIFIFTAGLILIEKSTGRHIGLSIKHFLTPGFASIVIGIGLFVLGVQLPDVIYMPLDKIGSATTPLAMFVVGFQLGKIHFKEMIGDVRLYVLSALKLLAMPAIFFAAMTLIFGELSLFAKIIILEMAMPVAACSTIYSEQYDGDVGFSTKGVLLTTVISIVTLSLFAVLVEL